MELRTRYSYGRSRRQAPLPSLPPKMPHNASVGPFRGSSPPSTHSKTSPRVGAPPASGSGHQGRVNALTRSAREPSPPRRPPLPGSKNEGTGAVPGPGRGASGGGLEGGPQGGR